MKLIVGLGNLGSHYAHTRHNLGFMIVDKLANKLGATWRTESKFKAAIAETTLPDGQKLLLAKPHTMMNLSGEAVQRLMQFYKLAPTDVWVVFDDVDVPFGRLRLRSGGSASGHQGVRSIMGHIGSGFWRIKAGISLNDRTREPSEVYVLKPFSTDEQPQLPNLLDQAAAVLIHQLQQAGATETTFDLPPKENPIP